MPAKPDITLFADASVSTQGKACGWGYWIKRDGRTWLTAGGSLPDHPSSEVAEMMALAEGLEHAEARGYFRTTDRQIMLQSDNASTLSALHGFTGAQVNQHQESAKIDKRKKRTADRQGNEVGVGRDAGGVRLPLSIVDHPQGCANTHRQAPDERRE